MNVLFFGTPQIAVPYLEWLTPNTNVVGVVCRPDEPAGRGQKVTPPPTKVFAESKNIPVFQPEGPWTDKVIAPLKELKADVGIAVAYGRIMPPSVFSIPKHGCMNIHFSLLPKYRGAAPMQWALINGETKTGVTAFWIEEGLDSGPIFYQIETTIAPQDRAPELQAKLVPLGIRVLVRAIAEIEKGNIVRTPQTGEPSVAPILKKEMGIINWKDPAEKILNLIRGVCEWPGAATQIGAQRVKISRAVGLERKGDKEPGTIVDTLKDKGIVVQTGENMVLVTELQPEGKKVMPAWAFWQGARMNIGDKLG